jgi:PAS domain S-box-containing protein
MVSAGEANNTLATMREPPGAPSAESTATAGAGGASDRAAYDQMWEAVFEHAPLGMAVFDEEERVVHANAALAEMLHSTPARLAGRALPEMTHPDDRARAAEAARRLFGGEATWVTIHHRCLREDGQVLWAECACRIFRGPQGQFQRGLAVMRDVTDAIRAETALKESELRNWRIAESNMMGLFEWHDEVTITEANDAFLQMIGYTHEDLRAGRIRWQDVLPPESSERVEQLRSELLTTGRIRPTRMEYLSRTGARIPVLAGGARISWSPVRGIGFVLDMSEQVKIEEDRARVGSALRQSLAELEQAQARLRLADRMASMGTLAAGVAHEINNPLGFVVANLGFAQEEVASIRAHNLSAEEVDKRLAALTWALSEAQEGAARVRNIVLDLRTFSHPDTELGTAVDPQRVVEAALTVAHGELKTRAKVIRRFQPVPAVVGNEARLSQLFLNLIVNAAQAIPLSPGGTARGADAITVSISEAPDRHVLVEISDTGPGLPAEDLAHVFDPFFTTKRPTGLGSGLGLSICHGIVRSLGGEISARSTPGEGTTFRVLLPAVPEHTSADATSPADATPPLEAADAGRKADRARILVVDDEPLMGSAMERVLSDHDVVAMTSARAALARIDSGERFDVILCDMMMPDMNGMDLHEHLSQRAPDLVERLVFVTGGAYTTEAMDFLERVPNLRLEKPLLPEALHRAVARVMDAAGPSMSERPKPPVG